MSSIVEEVLKEKEDFLRRHLVLSDTVIAKLQQRNIIGELTMKHMLKKSTTPNMQMAILFDAMRARGLTEFINFLHVLRETSHGWLADDIYESKVNLSQAGAATKISLKEFIKSLEEDTEKHNENHAHGYTYPAGYFMYPGVPFMYPVQGSMHAGQENGEEYHQGMAYPVPAYMPRNRRNRKADPGYSEEIFHREYQPSLENASKQLKSLGEVYEREGVSADQSMTLLKQEELALRSLLENNVQEQQVLLNKKEAIIELEERMKDINVRASLLHTEDTDKMSRARLRQLKRVPFRYTHAAVLGDRRKDTEKS